jgi:hypothetical protein
LKLPQRTIPPDGARTARGRPDTDIGAQAQAAGYVEFLLWGGNVNAYVLGKCSGSGHCKDNDGKTDRVVFHHLKPLVR